MPSVLPPFVTMQPRLASTFGSDGCHRTTQVRFIPLAMAFLNSESIQARAIGFISSSKERQLSSFLLEGVTALNSQTLERPEALLAILRGSQ